VDAVAQVGDEPAGAGGEVGIGGAVHPGQVWSSMRRTCSSIPTRSSRTPSRDSQVGAIRAVPAWAAIMAVKIGLRTRAKTPCVTSSVRSA